MASPFQKTATQDWIIWVAPFGRLSEHLPAELRFLERASHSQRGVPNGQLLPGSLNHINTRMTEYSSNDKTVSECIFSIAPNDVDTQP